MSMCYSILVCATLSARLCYSAANMQYLCGLTVMIWSCSDLHLSTHDDFTCLYLWDRELNGYCIKTGMLCYRSWIISWNSIFLSDQTSQQ